ncbi:hypothetical protein MHYP_G00230620 [Metynnis hypsauchen]
MNNILFSQQPRGPTERSAQCKQLSSCLSFLQQLSPSNILKVGAISLGLNSKQLPESSGMEWQDCGRVSRTVPLMRCDGVIKPKASADFSLYRSAHAAHQPVSACPGCGLPGPEGKQTLSEVMGYRQCVRCTLAGIQLATTPSHHQMVRQPLKCLKRAATAQRAVLCLRVLEEH